LLLVILNWLMMSWGASVGEPTAVTSRGDASITITRLTHSKATRIAFLMRATVTRHTTNCKQQRYVL